MLLFIAGLRNISTEIYEAANLDGAGRWAQFRRITWPLIWPVTVLVFTIQLILQFKIFDQVYLFAARPAPTMVMVQYIYTQAFQMNKGGLAAASSVVLFLLIVVSIRSAVPTPARARPEMTASAERAELTAPPSARRLARLRHFDAVGLVITLATLFCAVGMGVPALLGAHHHVQARIRDRAFRACSSGRSTSRSTTTSTSCSRPRSASGIVNSLITSAAVTIIVIIMAAGAGYAISQLNFPGRRLFWWMILASFMVPIPALIVTHFIVLSQLGLINTLAGVVGPQLIAPVTVIIYKQFFDSVPKDFREAAVIDGANDFQLLFRIYLPMNWGVTTALAIITFIGAWNLFLWPFLAISSADKMNITVGITQVHDAFGVQYGRDLAVAMLAALPVALVYLIFQRRVTQAIMLSAGIKG